MELTPERSQSLRNMQEKILANLAAGRPSNTGISTEELSENLAWMRSHRAPMAAKGGKASGKSKSKGLEAATNSLDEKLKALGLNAD